MSRSRDISSLTGTPESREESHKKVAPPKVGPFVPTRYLLVYFRRGHARVEKWVDTMGGFPNVVSSYEVKDGACSCDAFKYSRSRACKHLDMVESPPVLCPAVPEETARDAAEFVHRSLGLRSPLVQSYVMERTVDGLVSAVTFFVPSSEDRTFEGSVRNVFVRVVRQATSQGIS